MKWIKGLCVVMVFVLCFLAVQQLFMPKYMDGVYDGALIAEYYNEPKNHQVVFIGDCEVYENFSPVALWQQYGISSYIRGGPQQLIWHSYYLLEDTLRYETPDVIVFNVLAMKFDQPQSEAYNRLNLDGMRWSKSKAQAVSASMMPEESFASYVLPILRYHERWPELTSADLEYFFARDNVAHNGYMMRNDVKPVGVVPQGQRLRNYQFADICYEYLDKMTALCKQNGVRLVLVKAPSLYPYWYDEWDAQMRDYALQNDLLYLNFLEDVEDIGIDWQADTYDAGLHLNCAGAEKMSAWFGRILSEELGLPRLRDDAATAELWAQKTQAYQQMKQQQLSEIQETGSISTYTYTDDAGET